MLRDLYEHFGAPENDDDAILACQIASVRLYGFPIDLDAMAAERVASQKVLDEAPLNVNSAKQVKEYISELMVPPYSGCGWVITTALPALPVCQYPSRR